MRKTRWTAPKSWTPPDTTGPVQSATSDHEPAQEPRSFPTCILLVSPSEQEAASVCGVFAQKGWTMCTVQQVAHIAPMMEFLLDHEVSTVICDRDLRPGTWRDVLAAIAPLPDPPLLIVASQLADEGLWAEVLNRGGFDVLMKPFDADEVLRVVESASREWKQNRTRGALTEAFHAGR